MLGQIIGIFSHADKEGIKWGWVFPQAVHTVYNVYTCRAVLRSNQINKTFISVLFLHFYDHD